MAKTKLRAMEVERLENTSPASILLGGQASLGSAMNVVDTEAGQCGICEIASCINVAVCGQSCCVNCSVGTCLGCSGETDVCGGLAGKAEEICGEEGGN